jgi:hypothetical protein
MNDITDSESSLPVSRAEFDDWRAPREGSENPTRMDNPVWTWLVRSKISAYEAVDRYGAGSAFENGPTWCFERYGQSITLMPDGRRIHIGGEHEDHYDPDFHIYNDVVVIDASGEVSIYGYPTEVFPPTDFHSATLVGTDIHVIGRLGYQQERLEKIDAIRILDTATYRFRTLPTSGDAPPWLHEHVAELDAEGKHICITGGTVHHDVARILVENLDTWKLSLDTSVWTHVARRQWLRWKFACEEIRCNALWEIRQMLWNKSVGWMKEWEESKRLLATKLGPSAEPERIAELYSPPVPHTPIESRDEEFNVHRISVEGVTVRYVEETTSIVMTIEGQLPDRTISTLIDDLCRKLSIVEGINYAATKIDH